VIDCEVVVLDPEQFTSAVQIGVDVLLERRAASCKLQLKLQG
jgi:hypothetical protein